MAANLEDDYIDMEVTSFTNLTKPLFQQMNSSTKASFFLFIYLHVS
ncbi:unnamed protein product [Brassica oleracea]|uniref:(rape) hypothetical protein n=1 Tax=Brassica napus TaxID=3708 RepID=A0A816MID4_BRANA|nr:unnamed protein product [Brassica napus]